MLVVTKSANVNAGGRKARRMSTATQRAIRAFKLTLGIVTATRREAIRAAGASFGYVNTFTNATDIERDRVRSGTLSLSRLHNSKHGISDREVDRLVARVGADKILAALDRYTSPTFPFPIVDDLARKGA